MLSNKLVDLQQSAACNLLVSYFYRRERELKNHACFENCGNFTITPNLNTFEIILLNLNVVNNDMFLYQMFLLIILKLDSSHQLNASQLLEQIF